MIEGTLVYMLLSVLCFLFLTGQHHANMFSFRWRRSPLEVYSRRLEFSSTSSSDTHVQHPNCSCGNIYFMCSQCCPVNMNAFISVSFLDYECTLLLIDQYIFMVHEVSDIILYRCYRTIYAEYTRRPTMSSSLFSKLAHDTSYHTYIIMTLVSNLQHYYK